MNLYNWKARRAGGRITITAKNERGEDVKIVGVDTIESAAPVPVAVDKDGRRYALH